MGPSLLYCQCCYGVFVRAFFVATPGVAGGARQFAGRGDSGWCWGVSAAGVWALCQVSGVDGGGRQVGVRRLLEDEGGCWKRRLPAEEEAAAGGGGLVQLAAGAAVGKGGS